MEPHLRCLSATQNTQLLFLLVHGTWAKRASWTEAQAPLPRALHAQWPDAGIYCFDWSGRNGVAARLKGADDLVEALSVLRQRYPLARVVVLAHSHGGNVACLAATKSRDIDTVVYLNTPFLRVFSSRNPLVTARQVMFGVPPPFNRVDLVAEAVRWMLLPIWVAGFAFVALAWDLSELNAPMAIRLAAFFASTVAFYVWLIIPFRVAASVRSHQSQLISVAGASRSIRRELVVGATGDEALSGLVTASTIQRTLGSFCRAPLAWMATQPLGLVADIGYVRWIVLLPFAFMLFLAMVAYGPMQGLMAAESHLVVSASPTGKCEFLGCDAQGRGLRHSLVYTDPVIVASVVAWLEEATTDVSASPDSTVRKQAQRVPHPNLTIH